MANYGHSIWLVLSNDHFYNPERKMNKEDFHIPFLHGMIVVAIVTVVSMAFAHFFINDTYFPLQKTTIFTSSESQYSSEQQ